MPSMKALTRLILITEEFRKIDPELPMQSALILLLIGSKPGTNLKSLAEIAGIGTSSASRIAAALSKEYGKGLVTYVEDPLDRRNKQLKLTPEGERFVRSLEHYVGGAA